jgi:3-(3-hydroxy-phenyl)propionate hydroxylase
MTIDLPSSVDVLVCGFGPVGATLANLLGQHGVRTLVIDKDTEIFRAPRAIVLDNEALRILQMAGLEEGAIDTVAIPRVRMRSPLFGEFARARTLGQIDGHPKLVTFLQPQLEAVLRERLAAYPGVSVATGLELVGFEQEADGVAVTLRRSGGEVVTVRTQYLVGADGANSAVRRLLEIPFDGETFGQDWLVVDAKRIPVSIDDIEFLCDPRRPGPHMVAPGGRQRWEFMLRPGESRAEMERPDIARRLLAPWIGTDDVELERLAVYRFHARVARRFSEGRIFLAGDAAHITPPFAGQGLVAGLRDAANLGWKLVWVVKERAAPSILASYGVERRPHVKAMISFARFMGALVMPRNRAAAFLIHGAMIVSRVIPGLRSAFTELEIKPRNRFRRGLFARNTKACRLRHGGLLPQGWLRRASGGAVVLGDEALGGAVALIGFGVDPTACLSPNQLCSWRAAGGAVVPIIPRGVRIDTPDDAWEDVSGTLVPDVADGWIAIVRPDRTIMVDGPPQAAGALVEQTLKLFGRTASRPDLEDKFRSSQALMTPITT